MNQSERGGRAAPFQVTSAIPGRVRLRFADARAPITEVAARVRDLAGVEEVQTPAGTGSLVVRYDPTRCDLEQIVSDIEGAAASAIERAEVVLNAQGPTLRRGRQNGTGKAINRRTLKTEVLHQMPGRLRMRLQGLSRHPEIAARLEHQISKRMHIDEAEVLARDEFVIVRYDPDALSAEDVARTVRRLFAWDLKHPLPDDEFHRAADLKRRESPKINPLLFPSLAYGLALVEAAPVVVGGALVLAALPVAMRAGQSLRRPCLVTDQFDILSLGLLAARGNFVSAGLMSWLLAVNDLTRRNAREEVRRTASMWQSGQHRQKPGEELATALETAPLSNTHVQTGSLQGASRLFAPLVGVAVTDYLINRDPSRVIGILKPRCEFESGMQFVVPATILTAMTSAAENGVLFTSAKAVERLAIADTALLVLSRYKSSDTIAQDLQERGFRVSDVDEWRDALDELQIRGKSVLMVTDDEIVLASEPRAAVNLYVPSGEPKMAEGADIVLADADLSRVVFAVGAARKAIDSGRHNTRLLTGAAIANVVSTLAGASSAPFATLINAGTTITAAMNALRTKPVPEERPQLKQRSMAHAA